VHAARPRGAGAPGRAARAGRALPPPRAEGGARGRARARGRGRALFPELALTFSCNYVNTAVFGDGFNTKGIRGSHVFRRLLREVLPAGHKRDPQRGKQGCAGSPRCARALHAPGATWARARSRAVAPGADADSEAVRRAPASAATLSPARGGAPARARYPLAPRFGPGRFLRSPSLPALHAQAPRRWPGRHARPPWPGRRQQIQTCLLLRPTSSASYSSRWSSTTSNRPRQRL
jgi:hypothetical protein